MNKYLAILGITTLLMGCATQESNQSPAKNEPAKTVASSEANDFIKGEHSTQGTVRIVTDQGKRYLELSAFKTDNGPDLFVLLHRANPPQRYQTQDYVNLGKLQKVSGTQRYVIPENVNLTEFQSVVIWCRLFNATFGFAPLNR